MGKFYTSPIGPLLPAVTNLLFWLYFLNFNLAIFNALPIWPLDGGQAFQIGIKAFARGRLSEEGAQRVTIAATFVLVAILLLVILGPYSGLF
jgi:membrane-associated protease RseP (regulator of RpoE activity)